MLRSVRNFLSSTMFLFYYNHNDIYIYIYTYVYIILYNKHWGIQILLCNTLYTVYIYIRVGGFFCGLFWFFLVFFIIKCFGLLIRKYYIYLDRLLNVCAKTYIYRVSIKYTTLMEYYLYILIIYRVGLKSDFFLIYIDLFDFF